MKQKSGSGFCPHATKFNSFYTLCRYLGWATDAKTKGSKSQYVIFETVSVLNVIIGLAL